MEDISPHSERPPAGRAPWQQRLYRIIFEHDTPAGRVFDVALMAAIGLSITAVSLESVTGIKARYGRWLEAAEWAFTLLFTLEYVLRLISLRKPWRYALSFFGIVDLLAVRRRTWRSSSPGRRPCWSSAHCDSCGRSAS